MARLYEMRMQQCKDNGTECTGGGTKNMLTPRKNKLLDCTILYPTKTPQFFRHCLWKVNLQKKTFKNPAISSKKFHGIIWHLTCFHIQKLNQSDPLDPFVTGFVVLTELLVSEALQTSFLSDPGVVLSGNFGACWSIVDGTVSVICFWWWDVALEKTCKQHFEFVYI